MNPMTDRFRLSILALLTISTILAGAPALAQAAERAWNFDRDPTGKLPANFASALTGGGPTGQGTVTQDESTASTGCEDLGTRSTSP